MKFLAQIFLVFFIFFQISSSVISMIETEEDVRISMLFEEDEQSKEESKEIKEFKTEYISAKIFHQIKLLKNTTVEDNHGYILKDYSSYKNLFLPPPEQI